MPSALGQSRRYLRQALAEVRSGIQKSTKMQGEQGPPIAVEPFGPFNSSTAAGFIKLGTSIASARRSNANFKALQQDANLLREKARAEIALIRAQEKYNLGEGRQTGRGASVLTTKVGRFEPGTPLTDVNAGLSFDRLEESKRAHDEANRSRGRISAATAALKQIDANVNRDAEQAVAGNAQTYNNLRGRALGGEEQALRALGISSGGWDQLFADQKTAAINNALKNLATRDLAIHRDRAQRKYGPQRQQYQDIIDEGASGGFESMGEGEQGGADPNNPLGLDFGPDEGE
jgi:hypothetical protein